MGGHRLLHCTIEYYISNTELEERLARLAERCRNIECCFRSEQELLQFASFVMDNDEKMSARVAFLEEKVRELEKEQDHK